MDPVDLRLLELLSEDARLSLKALAGAVDMSSPAVAERLRRLQERGVIRRFTVEIDARAAGHPLEALVRVRPLPGATAMVETWLRAQPAVLECDRVTGEDCFVARVATRSIEELDALVAALAAHATTHTAMVKSRPVPRRIPPLRPR